MSSFKVGDVCVVVSNHWASKKQDGLEVTITGVRCPSSFIDGSCIYYVDGLRDNTKVIEGYQLRLKRPPNKDEFTAGEWELCPFNPYKAKELVT